MNVLGLSGGYHYGSTDSAAALIVDGRLVTAIEEERLTRVKHAPSAMPLESIRACLRQASLALRDIDCVAYYVNTYVDATRELTDHLTHWFGCAPPIHLVDHHLAHASSAYPLSGFDAALIVTSDWSGDRSTGSIGTGNGREMQIHERTTWPNSLGMYYALITQYLGFARQDEYKVMGLAAYGEPSVDMGELLRVADDRFEVNPRILRDGIRSMQAPHYSAEMERILGPRRRPGESIGPREANIAASAQRQFEAALAALVRRATRFSSSRNLCLAGGSALNVVANSRVREALAIDAVYVPPAPNDAGCAIGAAAHLAQTMGVSIAPGRTAALGPEWIDDEIERDLKLLHARYTRVASAAAWAADAIAGGRIVGWFQGRMEFGPRALGNRSILADPRDPGMKDRINLRVKFREEFRPFAPSVLTDRAAAWFADPPHSPFMSLVAGVLDAKRLPAITHVDGTARLQTVDRDANPAYHALIEAFEARTGVPVVLNTSFNYAGQPIVCTPQEAVYTFAGTGMDALVIGSFVLEK